MTNKEHYSRAALPVEQSVVSVSSAQMCVCVCVGVGGVYVLVEQCQSATAWLAAMPSTPTKTVG